MGGAAAFVPRRYARHAGLLRLAVADAEVDPIAPPEIDITAGEETGALNLRRPRLGAPAGVHSRLRRLLVTVPSPRSPTPMSTPRSTVCARPTPSCRGRPAARSTATTSRSTCGHSRRQRGARQHRGPPLRGRQRRAGVELDDALRGAKIGDILRFGAPPAGGRGGGRFTVLVKEVKEKRLPALRRVGGGEPEYPTRRGRSRRPSHAPRREEGAGTADGAARRAIGSLVGLVDDDEVPDVLVGAGGARARPRPRPPSRGPEPEHRPVPRGHRADRGRAARGPAHPGPARGQGRSGAACRRRCGGLGGHRRGARCRVAAMAQRMGTEPEVLRDQIDRAGRTLAVRSEQRKTKALEWLVDHVEVVDEAGSTRSTGS